MRKATSFCSSLKGEAVRRTSGVSSGCGPAEMGATSVRRGISVFATGRASASDLNNRTAWRLWSCQRSNLWGPCEHLLCFSGSNYGEPTSRLRSL